MEQLDNIQLLRYFNVLTYVINRQNLILFLGKLQAKASFLLIMLQD